MHKTQNDLPEQTRTEVVAILNARLADSIALMHQSKIQHLPEVPALVEQAHADHRHAKVARGLEEISGEDPKPPA